MRPVHVVYMETGTYSDRHSVHTGILLKEDEVQILPRGWMAPPFAARPLCQLVRLFPFPTTGRTMAHPSGSEPWQRPVVISRCNLQPVPFRLRQHGTFLLGHTNIHVVNVCVTKSGFLPPCRRRYPPLHGGSPDPCRHWSFRGFRACRGVRGPNFHRVRPVNDTRNAVSSKPGSCLDERPDSPPAGRKIFFLPPGQTSSLRTRCISPVNDTRYAVSSKPGGCLDERPDSPPAGRKNPSLFHKTFALCANVL